MWTNNKQLSEYLTAIPFCDFLLCNGNDELIGFKYDGGIMNHPKIQLMTNKWCSVYILKKITVQYDVPVYENKVLVHAFFRKFNQKKSDYGTSWENLWKPLANYYSRIEFRNPADLEEMAFNLLPDVETESDFMIQLNHDVLEQFYFSERKNYKGYSKRAFMKIKNLSQKSIIGAEKVCKAFIEKLKKLAEENHLKVFSESGVLEHQFIMKESDEFWATKNLWIFIDSSNQLIHICNCYVYVFFKYEEYVSALCWIKSFWSENFKKQKRNLDRFKQNLYINKKNYEIAKKSVSFLIEQKLKAKGIIYSEFSNTVYFNVCIKKDDKRKYVVLITWNYFNSHPKDFSDFLDRPHVFGKPYFWCKELLIKKGEFEGKT